MVNIFNFLFYFQALLPRNGVDGLPGDFKINQIQELIELMDQIEVTKKPVAETDHCDICVFDNSSVRAQHYCVQCTKNMCENCSDRHAQNQMFKDHSTICIDIINVTTLECKEHQEEIKYYCSECSEILCTVCVISRHGEHQIKELTTASEREQDQIKQKLGVLKEKLHEFDERAEQLERLKGAKERIYQSTQEAVKSHSQSLIELIQCKEQKLLEQLETSHKTCMEQISQESENTNITAGNIASLYDFGESMTDCSQSLRLMAMYAPLHDRLAKMAECKCPPIPSEIKYTHKFKQVNSVDVGELTRLKLKRNRISTIANEKSKLDHNCDIYNSTTSEDSPRPFVDVYSFAEQDNVFLTQAENIANGLFNCPDMNLLWKKHDLNSARDVAFLPDKSIVITEYQSRSEHIKLYDASGNLMSKTVPRGRLDWMRPWGIVSGNQEDAIFHITDQRNMNIRSLDRQLSVTQNIKTHLQKPTGIALSREGHYIVTDTSSRSQSVSIIDREGRNILQWGSPGSEDNQFNNPEFITTDSKGRIIVSDNLNHCIKLFDMNGQYLFKFKKISVPNTNMCNPEGIAVDAHDNILVANGGNVSLFSQDGIFICHFEMPSNSRRRLSLRSDDRCYGIAVHPEGILAVTAHSSLYVYNIDILGY